MLRDYFDSYSNPNGNPNIDFYAYDENNWDLNEDINDLDSIEEIIN